MYELSELQKLLISNYCEILLQYILLVESISFAVKMLMSAYR